MVQVKGEESELETGSVDLEEWKGQFARMVFECSKSGIPFTSEHIASMIDSTDDPNSDDLLLSAHGRGIIVRTGEKRNGYEEWVGV